MVENMSHGSLNPVAPITVANFRPASTAGRLADKFLGTPVVVKVGKLNCELALPENTELVELNECTNAEIDTIRENTSHYQPLMLVVNSNQITKNLLDYILAQFDSQLVFKVILVRYQPRLEHDGHRCLTVPMLKPCGPVLTAFLPRENDKLLWELSFFFTMAKKFHSYCKRVAKIGSLTDREWKVANYIALGFTNHKIGALISFSEKTVEKCRSEIYSRLEIGSGPEVAALVTFKNLYRWPSDVAFPKR